MAENVEKAAVKDAGDSGGGESTPDKAIKTQAEASRENTSTEQKLKNDEASVIKANNEGASLSGYKAAGSPEDIYKQLSNAKVKNGENGVKVLDLAAGEKKDAGIRGDMGIAVLTDGEKKKSLGDAAAAPGDAGKLSINAPRGDRAPRPADATQEVQPAFGKKPDGGDKNVERSPEQQTRDNQEGVLKNFRDTLEKSGVKGPEADARVAEMKANLEATQSRLAEQEKAGHLKNLETGKPETAESQMKRVYGAMNDVLEGQKGKDGPYGAKERANWASGAAAAIANPDRNVNQGAHMTCALTSLQKQRLESGDPAAVIEEGASVANRGGAFSGTNNGENGAGDRKWTSVHALSIKPDGESSVNYDAKFHGDGGKRSLFGQGQDAFGGAKVVALADEKAGRPPGSTVYLTANAEQFGVPAGQSRTGEAVVRIGANGEKTLTGTAPPIGVWHAAELNQHMTGKGGGTFVDSKLAGNPPKGYEHVKATTFHGADDLKNKTAAWQRETGSSAQIVVNAPFLRNGGHDGHGLHAMNAKIDKDGDMTFDNNWGRKNDLGKVSDKEINDATNPDSWKPNRTDAGPAPDRDTNFGPRTGRNPNETESQFQQRREEEKKKQEEDEGKKKESEAKKKEEEETRKKKEQDEKLQKEKLDKQSKADNDFQRALAAWMLNKKGERPERGQFN